jgi:DNA-binding CsgD family transcriptional regulator
MRGLLSNRRAGHDAARNPMIRVGPVTCADTRVEQVLLTGHRPERALLSVQRAEVRVDEPGIVARGLRGWAAMSRSRRVAPPKGLEVKTVGSRDEFVLLSWPSPSTEPVDDELTPAERDVLSLVVSGASNAAIARHRGTSVRTVANQMARLLTKLNAGSRYELIQRFGGASEKT